MQWTLILLVLAFAICSSGSLSVPRSSSSNINATEFTVFGYLPEYRLANFDYENCFRLGVTHLIFFSLEIDTKSSLPTALDRLPPPQEIKRARAAADRFGAKLLLGFGGNARSAGFAQMASSNKKRLKFLKSLDKLLVDHRLDGVDYNWEYPANAKEWKDWNKLLLQSKQRLLAHSSQGDAKEDVFSVSSDMPLGSSIVTFTMFADPNHFKLIQQYRLLDVADYVHCMVYDMRQRHSTIKFAESAIAMAQQTFGDSVDSQGKRLQQKWTLGLPFYGRDSINGEPMAYYDIAKQVSVEAQALSMCYQSSAVPFVPISDDDRRDTARRQFYNSQNTLRMKTHMAMDAQVGGVMIWELGQDVQPFSHHSLLFAIFGCDVDVGNQRFYSGNSEL